MAALSSFPISRPTGSCAATGQPINPGDKFVAALVERQGEEGLERLDYCIEAWLKGERPKPPLWLFASWRGTAGKAEEKRAQFTMGDEELIELFEQLGDAADIKRQAFRFLLTLLLIRKRLLKYEGQRTGMMLVRRKDALPQEPVIEVIDPGTAPEAIAAAIEQLGAVMDLGASAAPTSGDPALSKK